MQSPSCHGLDRGNAFFIRYGGYVSRPDLVLLDLNLPLLTGHEVLEGIRAQSATRTLPVIVMSSSRASGDIVRAYLSGRIRYLHKPREFDELIQVMRSLRTESLV